MKKTLFFLFVLPTMLFGQVTEQDTMKFKSSLSVTGFYQGGNVQTWIFRTVSDVSYRPWTKWVYNTKNSFVYQAFGREKADQDFLSLNFLYLNPERKFYPQLIGIASTNFRRRISLRYLMGVGVTYQVINEKDNWLKFSISSEYERTNFSDTNFNIPRYDGRETINTFRGTVWINGRHKILDDKIILKHESYVQPSLLEADNYRWRADLGLEFPFWKFVSFNVNYIHTFESIVVENQSRQDQLLTFGLTLKNF